MALITHKHYEGIAKYLVSNDAKKIIKARGYTTSEAIWLEIQVLFNTPDVREGTMISAYNAVAVRLNVPTMQRSKKVKDPSLQ